MADTTETTICGAESPASDRTCELVKGHLGTHLARVEDGSSQMERWGTVPPDESEGFEPPEPVEPTPTEAEKAEAKEQAETTEREQEEAENT